MNLYDDGPVTIQDIFPDSDLDRQQDIAKRLNEISTWRLSEMIKKYPALAKSWEYFLIDYHICLSNEVIEENDDIPF
jgi:hypothetical protein